MASQPSAQAEWLSLTALGRVYGISAVQCGRLLRNAGLRSGDGAPSHQALRSGLARPRSGSGSHAGALWQRQACGAALERQGVEPVAERRLVDQWADLLEALIQGDTAVSTSPEEMAQELPGNLVEAVNAALRQRGSGFQLSRPSRRAQPRRASQPHRAA